MDLRHLTDEALAEDLNQLVKEEKALLSKVLHHLKEFEGRRLFSAMGYTSLFDYSVQKLGYSEDQAYRRIAAPRVARESGATAAAPVEPPSKAALVRHVWRRDRSRCTQCGSRHALQVDHILPRALGGKDTEENLRLLCRHCNQRAAIEKLGAGKMRHYLREPVALYRAD